MLCLRGGTPDAQDGAVGHDAEDIESEDSPELVEMLADPRKRDLAYNATVMAFHREQDRAGGQLSEDRVKHYFWSHMLLRHPEIESQDYNETHFVEFIDSFHDIDVEDVPHEASLESMWMAEQARGRVGPLENATTRELVSMSERAFLAMRRPLLHVPRDYPSLDLALPELSDGGTLLVGRGEFSPSAVEGRDGGQREEEGEEEEEEEGYLVESGRHGLLISGSFIEQRARAAASEERGAGKMQVEDDLGAEVVEVAPVSEVVTKVWGRWEFGRETDGHIRFMHLLLQAPPASKLNTAHTRRALVSVAGSWAFERSSIRSSLSVVLAAVFNASVSVSTCALGGLGDAEGTEVAAQLAAIRRMNARHEQALEQARRHSLRV